MSTPKRRFGNKGEDAVADWLIENNYAILARNYQTRTGEVDIIASKGDVISFIEVKTRRVSHFPISNTVNYVKQKKIASAAASFILKNNIKNKILRFDVATVTNTISKTENNKFEINFIRNAFTIN